MGTMLINRSIHSEHDANHIAISMMLTLMLNLTLIVNGPVVLGCTIITQSYTMQGLHSAATPA